MKLNTLWIKQKGEKGMIGGLKARVKYNTMATNRRSGGLISDEGTLTGVAGRAGLSAGDPVVSGAAGDVTPGPRVAPLTSTRARHRVTRAVLTLTRGLTSWAPPSGLTHRVTPNS